MRTTEPEPAVAPGRPRSATVERAILRAAFALFIEQGIGGTSIERIARRAGVAKTSIYRRWTSRDILLAQAIDAARNEIAPEYSVTAVDRASPRHFLEMLLGIGDVAARPEPRLLMARLLGTLPEYPRLLEIYRETYFKPRRQAIIGALQRVAAAGLLPAATDAEALADMLIGALMHRLLLHPAVFDPAEMRAYVARLLRAAGCDLSAVIPDAGRL